MNEINSVGNVQTTTVPQNTQRMSFRATIPQDNSVDTFVKEQEKAKKNAKNQQRLSMGIQIGVLAALLASVGLTAAMWFKKPTKTNFSKISSRMPSLSDDCMNPKAKDFISKTTKILKTPKEFLDYAGTKNPRMVLFHGPTGTGKTFSAKMLAKEMGAEYGEVQFSDLSSEFIGKTAVNISKKFNEVAKLAKKHPDKQYVLTFNEIDSLINNVNKLGPNNTHLGQNRTSFLNGLDSIKDIPNLTIVGTTNINPQTANLDAATLSRLGNIFEIEKPIANEIKSSLKFHLGKSKAAEDLIKDDEGLDKIAKMIYDKKGAQRDVENIVDTSLQNFVYKNADKPDKMSEKLTLDYLTDAVNKKETWAAGIDSEAPEEIISNSAIQNSVMNAFWNFIAKTSGAKK